MDAFQVNALITYRSTEFPCSDLLDKKSQYMRNPIRTFWWFVVEIASFTPNKANEKEAANVLFPNLFAPRPVRDSWCDIR